MTLLKVNAISQTNVLLRTLRIKIEKNEINQQKKVIILQIAVHLHEDHCKNISLHFAQLLFTKIGYTDKLKSYGSAENSGNCNL